MGDLGGRRNGQKQEKEQRHTGELGGGQCTGRKAKELRVLRDTESGNVRFGKYLHTVGHCVLDEGDLRTSGERLVTRPLASMRRTRRVRKNQDDRQETEQMECFSPQDGEDPNTILLQENVSNYVKCPQTHPEGGLFSLFTKSGQSKGFLLCLRA